MLQYHIEREVTPAGCEEVRVGHTTEFEMPSRDPDAVGPRSLSVIVGDSDDSEITDTHLSTYCRWRENAGAQRNPATASSPEGRFGKDGEAWLIYIAATLSDATLEVDCAATDQVEFADGKSGAWPLVLKKNDGYALDLSFLDGGKKLRINKILYCPGAVPSKAQKGETAEIGKSDKR